GRPATGADGGVELTAATLMARLARGGLRAERGGSARAEALYERTTAAERESFDSGRGLARLHLAHGEYEQAERTCRRVIRLRPRDWRGYATLGLSFFRRGQYDRALAPWKQVVRLSPENVRGALNIAGAYCELGRVAGAARAG